MTVVAWLFGWLLAGAVTNTILEVIFGEPDDEFLAVVFVIIWPLVWLIGVPAAAAIYTTRGLRAALREFKYRVLQRPRPWWQRVRRVPPPAPPKDPLLEAAEREVEAMLVTTSAPGSRHVGCTEDGTWRQSSNTLIDTCDGCGEERA